VGQLCLLPLPTKTLEIDRCRTSPPDGCGEGLEVSFELKAAVICDGCGERHEAPVETRATAANELTWHLKVWMERNNWMTVNRGRYYTQAHCCPKCADSGVVLPKARNRGTKGPSAPSPS
jgi:hypothetical protein